MSLLKARLLDMAQQTATTGTGAVAPSAGRQRRSFRTNPHVQLSAGSPHRPPHQPDAVQARRDHGRTSRRSDRAAGSGTSGRSARRARRSRDHTCRVSAHRAVRWMTRRDFEVLMAHALGVQPRISVCTRRRTARRDRRSNASTHVLRRYRAGTPVAYITGRREFWNLDARRFARRADSATRNRTARRTRAATRLVATRTCAGSRHRVRGHCARDKAGTRRLLRDGDRHLRRRNCRGAAQRRRARDSNWTCASETGTRRSTARSDVIVSNPPYIARMIRT